VNGDREFYVTLEVQMVVRAPDSHVAWQRARAALNAQICHHSWRVPTGYKPSDVQESLTSRILHKDRDEQILES
jgi:hypothetical protein